MATKSQVLAAARRKWGKNVRLDERPGALPKARRIEVLDQLKAANDLYHSTKFLPSGDVFRALIAAARFVVDVNGDSPSIPALAKVLAEAEHVRDHNDAKTSAKEEADRLQKLGPHRPRFAVLEVKRVGSLAAYYHVHAEADTLAELLEEVGRKPAVV